MVLCSVCDLMKTRRNLNIASLVLIRFVSIILPLTFVVAEFFNVQLSSHKFSNFSEIFIKYVLVCSPLRHLPTSLTLLQACEIYCKQSSF